MGKRLKYPQCGPYEGPGKVYCLVNAILDDFHRGKISAETARARLQYLIALNARHHWMGDNAIRGIVYEAISELPIKPGRRLQRSLNKYVYGVAS